MARTRTVQSIVDEARTLADQVESSFVTDAQALVWAYQEYAQLYEKLVRADPKRMMTTVVVTVTDPTTREYTLPVGFHSIVAVDFETGGQRLPVEPFEFTERSFGTLQGYDGYGGTTARYSVLYSGLDGTATRLVFDRNPALGTYRVWYVPAPPASLILSDTIDGVGGWEDYVTWSIAIRMLMKEQQDASFYLAKLQGLEARIEEIAANRDAGRAHKIQDTYSRNLGCRASRFR
jgi:hypothetical protein